MVFIFIFIRRILSTSISLNERPLDIQDRKFNLTHKHEQSVDDEYASQVKTVRIYLFFGYLMLLFLVIYICFTSNKKSAKYKPIQCSDSL